MAVRGTSFIAVAIPASYQTVRSHATAAITLRISCIAIVNAIEIATATVSLSFIKIDSWEQAGAKTGSSSLRYYFITNLAASNLRVHLLSTKEL